MKGELVRITTKDKLELQGILFETDKKAKKALVHIHGWVGNFYENKFISDIAEEAVPQGFAFLAFNNRGAGIVSDFIKRTGSSVGYVRAGGSVEEFSDCVLDIKSAIDFLCRKGYEEIILQGHSLGCQKAVFYMSKTKDKRIKRLILISPVDDYAFSKISLGGKYSKALNIARKMVENGKGESAVLDWMAFYPLLHAKMFLNIADPDSPSGKIFNYEGDMEEVRLIGCPVLAIFGSKDEYQQSAEEALSVLKEKIKKCDTELIKKSGHGFAGFEKVLAKSISNWLK